MALRPPTTPTPAHPYRAGRSLSDIGLMDYNARFYDPLLGRFTPPDSIIPDPGSAIGYNRYASVANNPMIYTDPSGHCYTDSGTWIPDGQGGHCSFRTSSEKSISKIDPISGLPPTPVITDPGGVASSAGWDTEEIPEIRIVVGPVITYTLFDWTSMNLGWDYGIKHIGFDEFDISDVGEGYAEDLTVDLILGPAAEADYLVEGVIGETKWSGRKPGHLFTDYIQLNIPSFGFDITIPGYEERYTLTEQTVYKVDVESGRIRDYSTTQVDKMEGRFVYPNGDIIYMGSVFYNMCNSMR